MDQKRFHESIMIPENSEKSYKSPVSTLAFRMGGFYRQAVINCFNLNFEGDEGIATFQREVVGLLARGIGAFQELSR